MILAELVQRIVRQSLRQMRVSMPAVVVAYDAGRSMAQVQIVQPELEPDGTLTEQPVIAEVPVSWPRAGGAHLTFPLARGDTGMVVFADRDIAGWVSENDRSAPDSDRMHGITDAMFVPGIQGGGVASNETDVELSYAGALIRINPEGEVSVVAPSVTVTAESVTIAATTEHNGNISVTGDLDVSGAITGGTITQGGVQLGTHVHGGVTTGGGSTGGPI